MVITTWSYLKNQDLKVLLFLHLVSGISKDVHLDWHKQPAYFQRLVNEVLLGLTFVFRYLDDILVYIPNMETHLEHLRSLICKVEGS